MSKNRYLSKKEKEIISSLYQNSNISIRKIADLLGFHKNTIYCYKDYVIKSRSGKLAKSKPVDTDIKRIEEQKQIELKNKEQDLFQRFYTECKEGNCSTYDSIEFFLLHGKVHSKGHLWADRFRELPRYENLSFREMMDDILHIIHENLMEENKDVDIDI